MRPHSRIVFSSARMGDGGIGDGMTAEDRAAWLLFGLSRSSGVAIGAAAAASTASTFVATAASMGTFSLPVASGWAGTAMHGKAAQGGASAPLKLEE